MIRIRLLSKIILSGFVVTVLFFAGCSTQKNTFLNRNYHSITTLYNGYFNARESYRDGLRRLNNMHEDNYENVLSIFRYGSEQQMQTVAGSMDIAYQKASTAIRRHSMNIRGVEYNRWIDDSYFLIARSHYFKRDINLAVLTFEYIIRQYEDSPLKYKSKIWVAKSYIQSGQFNNAQQALDRLARNKEEGLLDRQDLLLYNMVYADFHLQQQNYGKASLYLENAAKLSRSRNQRTRLTFILAQTYHQERKWAEAQQTYARVLRLNPDFQMAFQARINMAMAFDTESGDAGYILSELEGMLRDSKNREFRDQIYYALAQFSMRQNQEDKAIEYYELALENYRGNRSQKGLSFLRLGEVFLDRKEYLKSAQMYDSTMTYLSREYPEFEQAGKKNLLLKELAAHIRIVEREDSLQRLARLSTTERNAILDQIIEDLQEQERLEREQEQERARLRQEMARHGRSRTQPGETEGGWYFYNPSAISFGRNEFFAKWGERDLEDLWRISNKQIMAFGDMGDFDMMDEEGEMQGGRVTRASLMENVPTTPEKLQTSNERIARAYYNKGLIFKDRLIDRQSAINSLEAVISRFPENENRLYSAYFLHGLFSAAGNTSQAQFYKNLIISEFPDTDFAKILEDPNYAENLIQRQNKIKELYKQAYEAYIAGNYSYARNLTLRADTLDKNLEQSAQFSFLNALITGKTSDAYDFIDQLTYVKENFEGTKVHQPATNLLAYLGSGAMGEEFAADPGARREREERERGLEPGTREEALEKSVFFYRPESVHFYVFIVDTRNLQIRELRNEINTFNRENFGDRNLNLSTLFFDERRQLITVTNFPDAANALEYESQIKEELKSKEYDLEQLKAFIISVDNYPVFYQERKLDEYLEFYQIAYTFGE